MPCDDIVLSRGWTKACVQFRVEETKRACAVHHIDGEKQRRRERGEWDDPQDSGWTKGQDRTIVLEFARAVSKTETNTGRFRSGVWSMVYGVYPRSFAVRIFSVEFLD